MPSPWIGITIAVADDDRGKNAADSGFYSGWKVGFQLGAGNISIQVLLHDPVEFAEVNRKGIFVGIGKEVKREKVANGNFCRFFSGVNCGVRHSDGSNRRCEVYESREKEMFA